MNERDLDNRNDKVIMIANDDSKKKKEKPRSNIKELIKKDKND